MTDQEKLNAIEKIAFPPYKERSILLLLQIQRVLRPELFNEQR